MKGAISLTRQNMLHWDKHTAGKRCLCFIFIGDKDADSMFIWDKNAPLDAFLSGIKMPVAFLPWWQVAAFTVRCIQPGIVIFYFFYLIFYFKCWNLHPRGSIFILGKSSGFPQLLENLEKW